MENIAFKHLGFDISEVRVDSVIDAFSEMLQHTVPDVPPGGQSMSPQDKELEVMRHVVLVMSFQIFFLCFCNLLEQRTLFESARECGSVASNLEIHGIFLQLCAHQLRRKASGDPGGLECSSVVCG